MLSLREEIYPSLRLNHIDNLGYIGSGGWVGLALEEVARAKRSLCVRVA